MTKSTQSEQRESAYIENSEQLPLLFESSWEVCCKSGGIYTVLRSKAPATVQELEDRYFLIGPSREPGASIEFDQATPPPLISDVLEELHFRGVVMRYGRWLITGNPQVLLVDLQSVIDSMPQMKYYYWKDAGVGSHREDIELNGVIAMGYATVEFLMALRRRLPDRPMLGHFHEWQGAAAVPLIRCRNLGVRTIFTTHATMVGRSLCAANVDLYDHLHGIDSDAVASKHGFHERFQLERAAAQQADVFTTVSGITGVEAEQFLGRRPEVLVPNGLNIERFSAPYQFQNLHRQNKQLIHEFVMGHFFPSYSFDLDRTLYMFTAGRYEFRNKGFDIFIESLYELNRRLKADRNGVTVVAFLIAPAQYHSLNVTTLNRQAMMNEMQETSENISKEMSAKLFRTLALGRLPTKDDLLDEYANIRLKRAVHAWRQSSLPPIVTHDLCDDAGDSVLCHLRHRGLINMQDDPVKVVFHPEFITSTSPVLGLEYDEFVRGCNIGVFPSYYEPWGYTPMECVVRGIPAITSDLSGFGAYVMDHFPNHDKSGIYVAQRRGVGPRHTIDQIVQWLFGLTRMTPRDRIELRNKTESYAEHFDWMNLMQYYREARDIAQGAEGA